MALQRIVESNYNADMSLRKCREWAGYSMHDVVDELEGIMSGSKKSSYLRFWRWEAGKKTPNITVLMMLADLYEVTLDELVGRVPFERKAKTRS